MAESAILAQVYGCPIGSKKFEFSGSFASHAASQVNAGAKYHCPKKLLAEMGMKIDRHRVERTFKTLSSLAQHIQAGN